MVLRQNAVRSEIGYIASPRSSGTWDQDGTSVRTGRRRGTSEREEDSGQIQDRTVVQLMAI